MAPWSKVAWSSVRGQDKFQLDPGFAVADIIVGFHLDLEIVGHGIKGPDDLVLLAAVVTRSIVTVPRRSAIGDVFDGNAAHTGAVIGQGREFLQRLCRPQGVPTP